MNILIVGNHYAVCSARYATDAFKRLGHDVRHIGPEMGRNIWGLTLPPEYVWTPDEDAILFGINGQKADLIIVMDSDPALLDIVNGWRHPAAIVWGVDNHVRDYRRPHFQHYFLAHKKVSVMPTTFIHNEPTAMLEDNPYSIADFYPRTVDRTWEVTHLPCCYDPTLHTPSPIPYVERAYDVAMIGVMYPERWKLVQALRDAGVKVLAGTGLVYDAYVAAHHNARIALCSSACGDVAQRIFETAAMGNVVMSDPCPDFQLLQPDGVWLYKRDADIVDEVRQILADPDAAQANIEQSMQWVSGHTWDSRAKVIVEWWEREHDAN